MKKILFMTPLLNRGGAEYQLLELVRGLLIAKVPVEITVLSFFSEKVQPEVIHYYTEFGQLKIELVTLFDEYTHCWEVFRKVRKFMKNRYFDVAHTYLSANNYALACFNRNQYGKLFLGIRNMVNYSLLDRLANRIWSSKVERYLTNSKNVAKYFIDNNNIDHNKVGYIYNGYSTSKYQTVVTSNLNRGDFDIPDDGIILVNISNMHFHHKGHFILLDALSHLLKNDSRYYLLLVGGGELRQQFEEYARDIEVAVNVRFTGFSGQTLELLSISDIYVCSSFKEGMSNSMMDAIMLGLPVVSTDVGAASEFVHDGQNGYVVPAGNYQIISEKVKAITQGTLTADLQKNALKNREILSLENMVARHLEIYGIRNK